MDILDDLNQIKELFQTTKTVIEGLYQHNLHLVGELNALKKRLKSYERLKPIIKRISHHGGSNSRKARHRYIKGRRGQG